MPAALSAARAAADELMRAGAYDELARLLEAQRDDAADEARAAVLEAAGQLCLACSRLQRETDDHQAAIRRMAQLEDDTCRRVERLLDLLWETPATAVAPAASPHSPHRPGLLQRLAQSLRRPAGRAAESTGEPFASMAAAAANGSPQPTTELPAAAELESRADVDTSDAVDLHIYCLGRFRAYCYERAVDDWTGNKSRSLFKYLLTFRDAPVHADQLLDCFWRDSSPEAARRSLYQTVYLVRQTFQTAGAARPVVVQTNGGYQLNPDLDVQVDSEIFLCRYREGIGAAARGDDRTMIDALQAAEVLYEGDFLPEDLYEEWPVARREQLRDAYLDLLDRLSRQFWLAHDDDACIADCRKLLEIDNCREDIHRRLMRAFARRGERSLALRQFQRCVEALRRELDVEPLPETVNVYEKILNNEL